MNVLPATALGILVTLSASAARADVSEQTPPPSEAEDRPNPRPIERSDADADAFRLGVLGGIGFPRPLAIEGLVKIERVAAFGLEYSLLPKTTFGDVATTFWALAADTRVFPFRNGFFVGVRGGHQILAANATVGVVALGSLSESARAETWFVNPRLGFLWTWRNGLTLGIDAGVQIPISPSLSSTLPPGVVGGQVDASIASVANTLGNHVTPTVDLLRVGFLF